MRIAVISDIHSNIEALEAVLKDIEQCGVDTVISLGDNIGYGPDPGEVIKALIENGIPSILGNHELAVTDRGFLKWFNPSAREAAEKNISLMSEEELKFSGNLDLCIVKYGCHFVHGFPPDSVTTYLFQMSDSKMQHYFTSNSSKMCFVGHTHKLKIIGFNGDLVNTQNVQEGINRLEKGARYIVNAGSVGQPRDGNNNAKYVIWDDSACTVTARYVEYNFEKTVAKILKRGIPEKYATRLR